MDTLNLREYFANYSYVLIYGVFYLSSYTMREVFKPVDRAKTSAPSDGIVAEMQA